MVLPSLLLCNINSNPLLASSILPAPPPSLPPPSTRPLSPRSISRWRRGPATRSQSWTRSPEPWRARRHRSRRQSRCSNSSFHGGGSALTGRRSGAHFDPVAWSHRPTFVALAGILLPPLSSRHPRYRWRQRASAFFHRLIVQNTSSRPSSLSGSDTMPYQRGQTALRHIERTPLFRF